MCSLNHFQSAVERVVHNTQISEGVRTPQRLPLTA